MKTSVRCSTSDNLKRLPPLSQSRHGDMACETLYVCKHVQCARVGESGPAARGTEIHQVLATYINHLVTTTRAMDLEAFDALMRNASTEAREVLEKFRDNHAFDPEKILATELHIALDENFLPVEHPGDDGQIADYEGTLDLVMLHSLTEAEIDDWKTQGERTRQRKLHELSSSGGRDLKVSPGRHCTWCPLLLNGCPVAETNPYGQMTAEERLRFALWLQEAEKQNTRVLKELMVEHGPIRYRDENESEYFACFVPIEKKFYPYQDCISILDEWFRTHPDERGVRDNLTISGLSSALKAEKRADLSQKLSTIVDMRVETELRIGREGRNGSKERGS